MTETPIVSQIIEQDTLQTHWIELLTDLEYLTIAIKERVGMLAYSASGL